MRNLAWGLLALLLSATAVQAEDHSAPAEPEAAALSSDWAPGPLQGESAAPPPERVASRVVGVALTLPKSWRGKDVSWRELDEQAAQSVSKLAQAALVIEYQGKKGAAKPLLIIYKTPLKQWRDAAREKMPEPGRVALTQVETGYVVIRPAEPETRDRYAELRDDMEDAVGTMALYDAYKEAQHLIPRVPASDFNGTLQNGSTLKLKLDSNGRLTLSFGKKPRTLEGRWFQRGAQVVVWLTTPAVKTSADADIDNKMLFHFDGKGLIIIEWDQKIFGATGGRLEPAQ